MPTGDAYSSGHLVPSLWDLHMFYLLRPILFRICRYFTGLCSSNIPRYFLDFAFLDVPYLSITHYNAKLGHDDLSEFDGKSDMVNGYIDSLNEFTLSLNEPYRSPRLSQDTIQCSKKRGQRARYRRNFSAYADGVHPDTTLSRLWALRILELISEVSQMETESSD